MTSLELGSPFPHFSASGTYVYNMNFTLPTHICFDTYWNPLCKHVYSSPLTSLTRNASTLQSRNSRGPPMLQSTSELSGHLKTSSVSSHLGIIPSLQRHPLRPSSIYWKKCGLVRRVPSLQNKVPILGQNGKPPFLHPIFVTFFTLVSPLHLHCKRCGNA